MLKGKMGYKEQATANQESFTRMNNPKIDKFCE
jgi:hypothetical protein